MLHENIGINENGNLTFAGADAVELAGRYGTPLIVLDEVGIRKNARLYLDTVMNCFGKGSFVAYACKALCNVALVKLLADEGMCLDVSSCGEIHTAHLAGFDMGKVFFHSNLKTEDDIRYAISRGVGYFMVDNMEDLEALNRISQELGNRQKIYIRVTPNVAVSTHKAVITGVTDSKFGFPIEGGVAEASVRVALGMEGIELCGFHSHIGSQIFEIEPFIKAAEVVLEFASKIAKSIGYVADSIILGGGFAVRYTHEQKVINYVSYIEKISNVVISKCKSLGMGVPNIGFEPGRSIIATNGMTLYTVGSLKEITDVRNYVIVDGGMADNPRYALYKSPYTIHIANRMKETDDFVATIGGRACESGDLLQENVSMPRPVAGDIVATLVTGAYTYSMGSNYNKLPRPPIVMIDGKGKDRVVVRRETLDEVSKLDVVDA